MARPARFELATPCFGGTCSIHLSYGRAVNARENLCCTVVRVVRDTLYDGLRIGSIGPVRNQPVGLEIGAKTKPQSAVPRTGAALQIMSEPPNEPLDLPSELFDFVGLANQRK
jgi:hypothetical protein